MAPSNLDIKALERQVEAYKRIKEAVYDEFVEILKKVLKVALNELGVSAIVQVRAKSIPSFAEKAIHRQKEFPEPLKQFRDLCGARVILNDKNDIGLVSKFIENHFEIIQTENVQQRLGPLEFGYQSLHYLVSLRKGEFEDLFTEMKKTRGDKITRALVYLLSGDQQNIHIENFDHTFRAEIQVRTLLQHAWANFAHDRTYKNLTRVPQKWRRDNSRIAATLEELDNAIARNAKRIDSHRGHAMPYMTRQQCGYELTKLQALLKYVETKHERFQLSLKIARLMRLNEDFKQACEILEPWVSEWEHLPVGDIVKHAWQRKRYPRHSKAASPDEIEQAQDVLDKNRDPAMASVLLDYGKSRWSMNDPRGRHHIELAIALDEENVDARIALAETYEGANTLACYEEAFRTAPADPRTLSGFLHSKLINEKSFDVVPIVRPELERAIAVCRERANVGVYLPQAHYDTGFFNFLLGRFYDSLGAYCKAVIMTNRDSNRIEKALAKIAALQDALRARTSDRLESNLECIKRLLQLAKVSKALHPMVAAETAKRSGSAVGYPGVAEAARNQFGDRETPNIQFKDTRIVIVAGGCDAKIESKIQEYKKLLNDAFRNFIGAVFCGGTTAGISGLVGDLALPEKGRFKKFAYLPSAMPSRTTRHEAYDVFYTDGIGFSAHQPIRNWMDLLAAGVHPERVRLLGINGGRISGFEFRLACMLGAKVGIIRGSGRAANDIFNDADWSDDPGLLSLPNDLHTVRSFVQGIPTSKLLKPQDREAMAIRVHDEYRVGLKLDEIKRYPSLADWTDLPPDLRHSNLQQVDHFEEKLQMVGFRLQKAKTGHSAARIDFSSDAMRQKVEIMAEIEHGRWNLERLQSGWKHGDQKDVGNKIHPHLIPWADLPEDIKEYDRNAIRAMPEILAEFGYEIVPLDGSGEISR